jgi:2-hydroxy-3-keto-5-methylthiopentenyl-1-phosphate phosphatase
MGETLRTASSAMSRAKTAIVYDFDGTLSPGSMQDHSLIPEFGYKNAKDFWDEVKAECKRRDGDEVLTYMELMLHRAKTPITRKYYCATANICRSSMA